MKHPLLIFCCVFAFSLSSQTNWQWALAPDSGITTRNSVEEMALDNNDNVFITGNYNFTLAMAGSTLPVSTVTPGMNSGYTAKINKNGAVQWFQTTSSVLQTNICTDDFGNSYVVGRFFGSLTASGTTLVASTNGFELYLLKYAPAGNLVWAKTIGTGTSIPQSMKQMGNKLYLSGSVQSSTVNTNFTFGSYSFATLPSTSLYYAQLDTSGAVLSAVRFGGFINNTRSCIALSPNGNITLSAWASGAPLVIGTQTLAAAVTNTIFNSEVLINISPGGTVNWAKRIDMASNLHNNSICSDINNNIYLVSSFNGGPAVIDNFSVVPTAFGVSGLLLKFDPAGSLIWSKTLESSACGIGQAYVYCGGITTDKSGNVSVSGRVNGQTFSIGTYTTNNQSISIGCPYGNLFIAQFESSGNPRGVIFGVGANANADPFQISVDNDYNVLIAGRFNGSTLYLGPSTLYGDPINTVSHLFVAKAGSLFAGIKEYDEKTALNIFPIPSKYTVTFTSDKSPIKNISIFDLTGKQIYSTNCSSTSVDVSIRDLAPGIYATRVVMEDQRVITSKIIKEE